jgi:hypothetical protein
VYYVTKIDNNTFKLSTTLANCDLATFVASSGTQSGTHTGYQSRARGASLVYTSGKLTKSGDQTRLYLGSFWAVSTSATADSATQRVLFNGNNRVTRALAKADANSSWTYGTATWRASRADSTNCVQVFRGIDEDAVSVRFTESISGAGSGAFGVGVGATTAPGGKTGYVSSSGTLAPASTAEYAGAPGLGLRSLQMIEYGESGTMTVYGTASPQIFMGLSGTCTA